MAKKVIKQTPLKDFKKETLIEAMLNRGEIIDTLKQPEHIRDLINRLFIDSGEEFRPNGRILSGLEKIGLKSQKEVDDEIADSSFLSVGEDNDTSSYLGFPPQFLKRDSRVYKMLIAELTKRNEEEDNQSSEEAIKHSLRNCFNSENC